MNTTNKSMQMYNECNAIYAKLYKNYKSFFDALKKEMVITEKWIDSGGGYLLLDSDGHAREIDFMFTIPPERKYEYFLDCEVYEFETNEEGSLSKVELCNNGGSSHERVDINIELSNPRYFNALSCVLLTYTQMAEDNGHQKLYTMGDTICDKLIKEYAIKYDKFGEYCEGLLKTYLKSNDSFSPTNCIAIAVDADTYNNYCTPPIYIEDIYKKRGIIQIEGGNQTKEFDITPIYWSLEDILTLSSELEEKLS